MNWKKLSKEKQIKILNRWIRTITKSETKFAVKKHMVKHAEEVYADDPTEWSASMRNMMDIFDLIFKVNSENETWRRLDKLETKYNTNRKRYTPPPKI
jgi:hypothetical protein